MLVREILSIASFVLMLLSGFASHIQWKYQTITKYVFYILLTTTIFLFGYTAGYHLDMVLWYFCLMW